MRQFGLIGKNLSHSFSQDYFTKKWKNTGIIDCQYQLLEIESISDFIALKSQLPAFQGFNVTIPYKIQIIPYLDMLTQVAKDIQAVNCIKFWQGKWIGHNTDGEAFLQSLIHYIPENFEEKALILGSGGASLAVQWALKQVNIPFDIASSSGNGIYYADLDRIWDSKWKLIINCSPVGMFPQLHKTPKIPYQRIDKTFYIYDLIYNPEKTLFLNLGMDKGSNIKNGLEMLKLQAENSWFFWND
ncbi:MAG: shikimate dehydrogenase [Saprospiraceae bacterium]